MTTNPLDLHLYASYLVDTHRKNLDFKHDI